MNITKHLSLLGFKVTDVVTEFKGVVTSVTFDLYGCVQVLVNPGIGEDGKTRESIWFDVVRLKIESSKPVIPPPNFEFGTSSEELKGPAEKPRQYKA